MKILSGRYMELMAWLVALVLLSFMNTTGTHYSLCIFKLIGIEICPGCGIGHSINYLLHGDIQKSFYTHPLGMFAIPVILYRIFQLSLFYKTFHFQKRKDG
ncbi:MAG: DUF2752 domain-containing protein [Ginsengibacter sp.]